VKPRYDELTNLNLDRLFSNYSSDGDGLTFDEFQAFSSSFSRYSEGQAAEGGTLALFNKVSRSGKVRVSDFRAVLNDWTSQSIRETEDVEVLTGTTFPSVRPNKQYEVQVPAGGCIYRKIKFNNPDDIDKSLAVTTDNTRLIEVRSPSLSLRARTGYDYIRLKFLGPPVLNTYDVRIYLTHKARKDLEECLLFILIVVPPDRFKEVVSAEEVESVRSVTTPPYYSRTAEDKRTTVANSWLAKGKQSS
jgi:hypothetical protein